MTILEDYLNSFDGIVVVVSHDRYFLDNVADRIFEMDGQGEIRQYERIHGLFECQTLKRKGADKRAYKICVKMRTAVRKNRGIRS